MDYLWKNSKDTTREQVEQLKYCSLIQHILKEREAEKWSHGVYFIQKGLYVPAIMYSELSENG